MSGKKFDLALQWERIRTVPGLGRDVAALTFLVVMGVVAAVVIQTQLTPIAPWADHTVVKAEFSSVPGANPEASTSVTIAGVKVGRITGSELTDHGTAVLSLDVQGKPQVYDNARLILRPKNPLNEMNVEINPGGPPGQLLRDGQVIPASQTIRPIQADEVLQNLDDKAQQGLHDMLAESDVALARAQTELPGGLNAATDTTVHLQPVVAALQTRRDKIAQLVSAMSEISGAVGENNERTTQLADSTQATLDALAANDAALRSSLQQLPGLTDELRHALDGTQRLTKQLNPTLDNLKDASEDLPKALDRFQDTTDNIGDVVDALGPVVGKARSVVSDLRPFINDANHSLDDLLPATDKLDRDTGLLTSYLVQFRAFFYNTKSVFGAGDSQTTIIRGHVVAPPGYFVIPQKKPNLYAPSPGENGNRPNPSPGGLLNPPGAN
ncbi:MlaD family protein [Pseudonocardia spinosispora]|uniref:MlaD family protein n=1 Tax=Pseudonocardia spinosispora TaxID=103441 RepID=UPI000419525D|nr:MlaD family protein [Pseudonocardia spinosispora]